MVGSNEPNLAAATASLAPSGTLRAAINFGNPVLAQRDPASGEPRGVSAALTRALAERLGVRLQFVPFDGAGAVTAAAARGEWDVAFLAIDPARAEGIDFTAPYVRIEGTYLVADASPIQTVAEVDRPGVEIMVDHGAAYTLFLCRTLTHATLVYPPEGGRSTTAYFVPGVNRIVLAHVRQPLETLAAAHPGYRVLPGRFMQINQAMGTVRGREAGLAYLRRFVEEMKAGGFVAHELAASGQSTDLVAPAFTSGDT